MTRAAVPDGARDRAFRRELHQAILEFPRGVLAGLLLAAIAGLVVSELVRDSAFTIVSGTSVPAGLYVHAAPGEGEYVSFCLGRRHAGPSWYGAFCSPDAPTSPKIVKRVFHVDDAGLTVLGHDPCSIDSRLLGKIRHSEVRAWWNPLWQVEHFAEPGPKPEGEPNDKKADVAERLGLDLPDCAPAHPGISTGD